MNEIISQTEKKLNNIITILHNKLATIIATGAHPSILNGIEIEYYETMTPLSQVASISAPDATMLIVKPFDRNTAKEIIESINKSSLGLNPIDEGEQIRIMIPPMTEEKRNIFVKETKQIGEEFKISLRNARTDSLKKIRNLEISENEEKQLEDELQKLVNKFNKEIEQIIKNKTEVLKNI